MSSTQTGMTSRLHCTPAPYPAHLGARDVPVAGVMGFLAYFDHSARETSPDQPFIEGAAQQPDATTPIA